MKVIYGFIDQIAVLELNGFGYTVNNLTGVFLDKININTYQSITGTKTLEGTKKWKMYQTRVGNHPHRPIFIVNSQEISTIYRMTTTTEKVLDDTTLKTNFYDYPVQFGRYHGLLINPGKIITYIISYN